MHDIILVSEGEDTYILQSGCLKSVRCHILLKTTANLPMEIS